MTIQQQQAEILREMAKSKRLVTLTHEGTPQWHEAEAAALDAGAAALSSEMMDAQRYADYQSVCDLPIIAAQADGKRTLGQCVEVAIEKVAKMERASGAAALSRQREQEEISRATLQPQQSISSPDPRGDDRDGSGLKDYAAYLERIHADDYLAYAARHLRSALLKASDAPCSAAQHERQARLALELGRVPNQTEAMDWASDAPRDPEKWPCSFSHHVHATREEAVECARKRTTVQPSAALSQPSRQLVACGCSDPDPVMQADRKFYCHKCSYQTGARPSGLEPERWMQSAALVPQGCKTCATCRHLRQETPMNKPPYGAICTHPMESHPMHWQETIETFGCIFHTPVPPLSPDPPQEK